jgi:hypothetical protein
MHHPVRVCVILYAKHQAKVRESVFWEESLDGKYSLLVEHSICRLRVFELHIIASIRKAAIESTFV